jgi:hydroxymethylbilane synthase
VAELLGGGELVEVSSDGEAGDKARFVRGVERALLDGEAEVGVHSAKDLPGEMPDDLEIAAVPAREDAADVWIGAGGSLDEAPEGARVGTASLRRRAQLLAARPDLQIEDLHGNVDTRLRKLVEGDLDAIVLAAAGLRRLGREAEIGFAIPTSTMVPAAGQGALALQVRTVATGDAGADDAIEPTGSPAADGVLAAALAAINDEQALRELTAERAAVALLDATCATPIGVHARVEGEQLTIDAFVGLPDGSEWIRDQVEATAAEPAAAGGLLAERLLAAGARDILDRAERFGAL